MSEKEIITEILQRIQTIPCGSPEEFKAAVLEVESVKRVYPLSAPKKRTMIFGVIITLPPLEEGEKKRFIPQEISMTFPN